jgi:hypothetical protein
MSVANFIDEFFRELRGEPVACAQRYHHTGRNYGSSGSHIILLLFPTAIVSVSSTIMAPPLDAATHMLIEILLQGLGNKLIAIKATCFSKRSVQRIRRNGQQLEMPTPRTEHGFSSCITSPVKKSFFNTLTEQHDLYQYEMSDYLSYLFVERCQNNWLVKFYNERVR